MTRDESISIIEDLQILIVQSVLVKVSATHVIGLLNHLTSRYFFNKSTYYVDDNLQIIHRQSFNAVEVAELQSSYIVCIDLHNRIVVFKESVFLELTPLKHALTVQNESDFDLVDSTLNQLIEQKPVIVLFNQTNQKNKLCIYPRVIELWLHDSCYEIERTIFDMMYAEGEDFNPTTDENATVYIHSEIRHQLYADKDTFVTDLLHSEIGLICDTQDRLIEELQFVPQPIQQIIQNK